MFLLCFACSWFKFFKTTFSETPAEILSEGTNICASSFFFSSNLTTFWFKEMSL